MAGWTLEEAQRRLQMFLDAEEAILVGNQAYTIADRSYTRADLDEIRKGILYWLNEVDRLEAGVARGLIFHNTRINERPYRG